MLPLDLFLGLFQPVQALLLVVLLLLELGHLLGEYGVDGDRLEERMGLQV